MTGSEADLVALAAIQSHPAPRICMLGAAALPDAYRANAQETGYFLREFAHRHGGSLFSGGVDGVGVEVYRGIGTWCRDQEERAEMPPPPDCFFIVPPNHLEDFDRDHGARFRYPEAYDEIAREIWNHSVTSIPAGRNRYERRETLAAAGDAFVAINGGTGTWDEMLRAHRRGKPVILLHDTGGAEGLAADISAAVAARHMTDAAARRIADSFGYKPGSMLPARDGNEIIARLEELQERKILSPTLG